ncbi:unnamed protein product [Lupinus luteus]|uniref:S-protein homolog n=1 Tax=Lupinus luteus TaxID=3873 RepID=A0AAV1X717_LUPLU
MMIRVKAFNVGFAKTIEVTLVNDISEPLTIHCKDKNHDDGVHTLKPDESHCFVLLTTVVPKTLWYCNFNWTGTSHSFDIYVQKRDKCDEKHCFWNIKKDGPCNIGAPGTGCYPWDK